MVLTETEAAGADSAEAVMVAEEGTISQFLAMREIHGLTRNNKNCLLGNFCFIKKEPNEFIFDF